MWLSSLLFKMVLEVLATIARPGKKDIHIRKEIKLSLFADYTLVCMKIPRTQKEKKPFLELISRFSKGEYKIKIQKSIALLYINNKYVETNNKNNTIYNYSK